MSRRSGKRSSLPGEETGAIVQSTERICGPGSEHALPTLGNGIRVMGKSLFSRQLLMDVGAVAPSDETSAMQLHDLVRRDIPMTAYQLDLAEDENGEVDFWRLAFAQHSEAVAADWGFELETPNLEESRLRKRAMAEVERRHDGFRMLEDCEEREEFEKEVKEEVRRLKKEAAKGKERKAR